MRNSAVAIRSIARNNRCPGCLLVSVCLPSYWFSPQQHKKKLSEIRDLFFSNKKDKNSVPNKKAPAVDWLVRTIFPPVIYLTSRDHESANHVFSPSHVTRAFTNMFFMTCTMCGYTSRLKVSVVQVYSTLYWVFHIVPCMFVYIIYYFMYYYIILFPLNGLLVMKNLRRF